MTRLLATLLAALLGACSGDPGPPCGKGTGVTDASGVVFDEVPGWTVSGEDAVARFRFGTMGSCQDTAEVTFTSADGTPGTATVTLDQPNESIPGVMMGGTIHFSAPAGGVYVLAAVVRPSGARAAQTVLVAQDRSGETHDELTRWCNRLALTAGGAVACDDAVLRGIVKVQSLAAKPTLAARGKYLWVYSVDSGSSSDGRLERYEDSGSGALTRFPAIDNTRAPCCAAEQLLAGEAEAFVLSARLERFTADGVSVSSAGSVTPPAHSRYLVRSQAYLYVVADEGAGSGVACIFEPDASGLKPVTWAGPSAEQLNGCQRLAGRPVGVSDEGVYVAGGSPLTLSLYVPQGVGMSVQASLVVPAGLTPVQTELTLGPGLPALVDGKRWLLPRLNVGALALDLYDKTGALEYRGSFPGGAFAISRAQPARTLVFKR